MPQKIICKSKNNIYYPSYLRLKKNASFLAATTKTQVVPVVLFSLFLFLRNHHETDFRHGRSDFRSRKMNNGGFHRKAAQSLRIQNRYRKNGSVSSDRRMNDVSL